MNRNEASTPGISWIFWILGGLSVLFGGLVLVMVIAESHPAKDSDIMMASSIVGAGLFLIGFGTTLDLLARIEHHLRPEGAPAPASTRAEPA
jgi:amino acid transporter